MIEVKDVSFSYKPDIHVLSGVSFSIKKGEFVAMLGANGAGKSTLLKLLLHTLTPRLGTITINGIRSADRKNWEDIGYVPQKMQLDLHHPATVSELLLDTRMCSHLRLTKLMDKQFKSLSGGQQQRVLVALALQNDPSVLLLDEPTVGIDVETRKQFYSLLSHLAKKHDKTILLVTHDTEVVQKYADTLLCIDDQHHFSCARCVHD